MKFDIAVIGGGPAGIAAAITAQSKGRLKRTASAPVCEA